MCLGVSACVHVREAPLSIVPCVAVSAIGRTPSTFLVFIVLPCTCTVVTCETEVRRATTYRPHHLQTKSLHTVLGISYQPWALLHYNGQLGNTRGVWPHLLEFGSCLLHVHTQSEYNNSRHTSRRVRSWLLRLNASEAAADDQQRAHQPAAVKKKGSLPAATEAAEVGLPSSDTVAHLE